MWLETDKVTATEEQFLGWNCQYSHIDSINIPSCCHKPAQTLFTQDAFWLQRLKEVCSLSRTHSPCPSSSLSYLCPFTLLHNKSYSFQGQVLIQFHIASSLPLISFIEIMNLVQVVELCEVSVCASGRVGYMLCLCETRLTSRVCKINCVLM